MPGPTAELLKAKQIGLYLGCDPAVLAQALAWQQQLAAQGIHKRLGEILLERRLVSRDTLWTALQAQRLDRLRSCAVFAGLNGSEGDDVMLSPAGPGECVGELGYFSDGKRSASVRAVEDGVWIWNEQN